jgi:ribonuclease-3
LATNRLEKIIGLRFRDQGLLQQALVHRSFLNEQGGSPLDSYERLEFLGDAVLSLIVSTELYLRVPHATEEQLSKGRAALVNNESLSHFTRRLNLGDFLLLGRGADATGGRESDSILAACFEALVAAVYLDQGYPEARRFVLQVMKKELDESCLQGMPQENPKSQLQEYFQGLGRPTPRYRIVTTEGPDHNPVFTVEVSVEDQVVGTGQGGKKADAERAAAQDALARLIEPVDHL